MQNSTATPSPCKGHGKRPDVYQIVTDQEDVQGPQQEDDRDRQPEALQPRGDLGSGLPDEGESQGDGRQECADRLEAGTSGERGEGNQTHAHDQSSVKEPEAHPALRSTSFTPGCAWGAAPELPAGSM